MWPFHIQPLLLPACEPGHRLGHPRGVSNHKKETYATFYILFYYYYYFYWILTKLYNSHAFVYLCSGDLVGYLQAERDTWQLRLKVRWNMQEKLMSWHWPIMHSKHSWKAKMIHMLSSTKQNPGSGRDGPRWVFKTWNLVSRLPALMNISPKQLLTCLKKNQSSDIGFA